MALAQQINSRALAGEISDATAYYAVLEFSAYVREVLQIMTLKPMFVSIGLSLALCVACGGSSDGGPAGSAGSAGSSSPGGSGGSVSPGGSGPGGSSPGSSGAGGRPSTASGDFSSGLSGDKQLGSLTDQEFAGLCQKLHDYVSTSSFLEKAEEFSCRISGLFVATLSNAQTDAELQSSCKTAYNACLAAPTTTTETCTKPDATCTATVAEYEACMSDSIEAFGEALKAVPACSELTLALLAMSGDDMMSQEPASCTALKAKCPSAPTLPGAGD